MVLAEKILAVLVFLAALATFADEKRHQFWVRLAVLIAGVLLILLVHLLGS